MSINLDYIFQKELTDEVTTPNEGDMAYDIDTDYNKYTEDEDEEQDDKSTDGAMENNLQGPIMEECEGAQHYTVLDVHEDDPLRLVREEV
ncbi:hypothetical protein AMTR_s00001p00271920 [Amborella trichopoda]|uniref:Uncharacterized protein n=1 Tax=Amborella trichopoda TaxID=13333 RepID=W1NMU7_AMBTC|nr:hypothetical protein AMTR_s00001p00271920 [Amborella trichopoda]